MSGYFGQSSLKPPPSQPSDGIPIIFTISRMNPPTPGHLELIRELIEKALEVNAPNVYVILSKTVNNSDNPIECKSKIPVLQQMVASLKETMKQQYQQIDNIQVNFVCVDSEEKSPISTISSIVYGYDKNTPNLDLFLIVGDDRADLIDTMEKLFCGKVNTVGGESLVREEMETYKNLSVSELSNLNIGAVPKSAFSASFVRNLVKYGLQGKFNDVYTPYGVDPVTIGQLYGEIVAGFAREPPKKTGTKRKRGGGKRTTTNKKSKKNKKRTRKSTRKYSRKRH
jgi:nicotinic acid mononucleotide adenylyltransferase